MQLCELAALYAIAISQNHPFVDGNKRTALGCMDTFLLLNGRELIAQPMDLLAAVVSLAASEMPAQEFQRWVCDHTEKLKR